MKAKEAEKREQSINILKTRDDPSPVFLNYVEGTDIGNPVFILQEDDISPWIKPGETIKPEKLRPRIEPWLTALCQSEHLSMLLGSGLSIAVCREATGENPLGMEPSDFGVFSELVDLAAAKTARAVGRELMNIEDQLRVANELLGGLEILGMQDKSQQDRSESLKRTIASVLSNFAKGVLEGESKVIRAETTRRTTAFNYLVSFLMSFASRTGTRDRLHIFTTNYDRIIEAGAEVAGMHLLDRFVGSLAPVFRSSRLDLDMHYNPPGIRGEPRYLEGVARFTKLHGSVDWIQQERDIRRMALPFGATEIAPFLAASGSPAPDAQQLMIYPNSAKDRETSFYPYVDLFRDLAAASCRPNHTLVSFGYGFGDEHINRIIEDMLTIPSTHLVVISYSDPQKRIMKTYENLGRPAQITLMIGDHVGEFHALVDHYLPKPAIDRTTFRMVELLKSRWDANKPEPEEKHDTDSGKTESGS
ncbi:MAG: SIR2 family protein [Rectinemataceae bacterium]